MVVEGNHEAVGGSVYVLMLCAVVCTAVVCCICIDVLCCIYTDVVLLL